MISTKEHMSRLLALINRYNRWGDHLRAQGVVDASGRLQVDPGSTGGRLFAEYEQIGRELRENSLATTIEHLWGPVVPKTLH